ncbi:hypothetical protein TKK_0014775 [Trichogramma kaykai]|uniref:Chloride channel CLIC-like protein 1 n=1 Tax=Trichogramma kaykai TaxID=54128 RepID=A0ABD2WCK0_9HYME
MKFFEGCNIFFIFCLLLFEDLTCFASNVNEQSSSQVNMREYVDPHSMYYSPGPYKPKKSNVNLQSTTVESSEIVIKQLDDKKDVTDKSYEVFARRLINILIFKANFKSSKMDEGLQIGKIELEATIEELKILKNFGNGKASFVEIDDIINNVIRCVHTSFSDDAIDFVDRMKMYLYHHRFIFGTIFLSVLIIVIGCKIQWTLFRSLFLITLMMILISFMLTWFELLQEEEIKQMAKQVMFSSMPDECRPNKLSWYSSVMLHIGFGKGDCFRYYEAMMSDAVLKVNPMYAFSHMCTKFFLHPISLLGHYSNEFISGLTASLPYPVAIFAQLVLILIVPILMFMLFFILSGGSCGFKIGPFFHTYIHSKQNIVNSPSDPHLLYHDRQWIETIRNVVHEVKSEQALLPSSSISASLEAPPSISTVALNKMKEKSKPIKKKRLQEKKEKKIVCKMPLKYNEGDSSLSDSSNSSYKSSTSYQAESTCSSNCSSRDDFPEINEFEKLIKGEASKELEIRNLKNYGGGDN